MQHACACEVSLLHGIKLSPSLGIHAHWALQQGNTTANRCPPRDMMFR